MAKNCLIETNTLAYSTEGFITLHPPEQIHKSSTTHIKGSYNIFCRCNIMTQRSKLACLSLPWSITWKKATAYPKGVSLRGVGSWSWPQMEGAYSDKHTSLQRFGTNNPRKKFYSIGQNFILLQSLNLLQQPYSWFDVFWSKHIWSKHIWPTKIWVGHLV